METMVQPAGVGLSEGERVIDTFIAPSKTFEDIRRKATWWLPFLLIAVVWVVSGFAVDKKVGFEAVTQQQVMKNPKSAEQMDQLPPDQRTQRIAVGAKITRVISYGGFILALLLAAICSLVLWLSANFGLGAQMTYGQVFAIWMYSQLPKMILALLNIVLLFVGVNVENYDVQNPVGTNLGYYLHDAPLWMRSLGSYFDIFGIWSLVLLTLGISIVARKSKGQAAAAVFGWWALIMLVSTAWAAITG